MTRSIDVEIGELILYGLPPADRRRIGEAVEDELTRLLLDQGVPDRLEHAGLIEAIDAGSFRTGRNRPAHSLGIEIARAVYEGLNSPE